MAFILPNQAVVLNAYAALIGQTPGNAALKDHTAYVADNGKAGYANMLKAYFASVTNADLAASVLANLGLTSFSQSAAVAALNSAGDNRIAAILDFAEAVRTYVGPDAAMTAAAAKYNANVDASLAYSQNAANLGSTTLASLNTVSTTHELTAGFDNLTGSGAKDTFNAYIRDNANTLQSGDKIDGGAEADTLFADIGNSQRFAITPETTSVETVKIRAQATPVDGTNGNNTSSNDFTNMVQIDAQRMSGVNQWESNNSRADVLIEDVRILDTQKTSDVTIAMVETDPGNVDFGVYFDQLSLRNASTGTSSLTLEIMDTRSNAAGTGPLKDSPYTGFAFTIDGVVTQVISTEIDAAQTYDAMVVAINNALKTATQNGVTVDLSANFKAALGSGFVAYDTLGQVQNGTKIVVTSSNGAKLGDTAAGTGWLANGAVPPSSGLHTKMNTEAKNFTELVTSKVILDDVGRGSTGGDLVIGGQSTGDTSSSRGVERFEIEVRDNSKLQTINSTNNALREVTIKNGATSNAVVDAYTTTVKDEGDLTVNGDATQALRGGAQSGGNAQLPGVENNSPVGQHHGVGAAGFVDVRLIDASAFKGKLAFTADITADSIGKYINLTDTQPSPVGDVAGAGNVNFGAPGNNGANFIYNGGNDNDTMVVTIDGAVAGSRSKVVSGQSDFTFDVNGGAGNDAITVSVIAPRAVNGNANWYNNQDLNNNIAISGGEGNDTIRTPGAGDLRIDAGAGDDVLYTDNTGVQINATDAAEASNVANGKAQWVFNTTNQTAADIAGAAILNVRDINDLRSDTNETYNLHKGTLTVTFKDLPSKAIVIESTGYKTSDLQINQAIKNAINNDAVLSKLLLAQDGPANTLVINSLIDGVMSNADLAVAIAVPAVNTLTVAEVVEAGKVYLPVGTVATEANVLAAMAAGVAAFNATGDYVDQMANDGAIDIVGAASVTASDNLITLGAGNDLVVLGTTVGADAANSSNETLVFSAGFGNDTVVNFANAGTGVDYLDFTALGGSTLTAAYNVNNSINVEGIVPVPVGSTTKAQIELKFNADNIVAQKHVFVEVNAHNVGSVWSVTNAIGANNAVATLEGSIDLSTTAWNTLAAANFVNSAAAGYSLINGGTGAAAAAPVVPPAAGANITLNAVTTTGAATALADAFKLENVAGNQTVSITGGFDGTVDKILVPVGTATPSVVAAGVNTVTDGNVNLTWTDASGDTVTVQLTGLAAATEAGLQAALLPAAFGTY